MKRIISVLLAVSTVPALLTACRNEKMQESESSAASAVQEPTEPATPEYPEKHTLYFKDSTKSSKAIATFFNSVSGKSENVEMKKTGEGNDSVTFSCEGNCAFSDFSVRQLFYQRLDFVRRVVGVVQLGCYSHRFIGQLGHF